MAANSGHARRILFDIYTSDEEPLYIDEMNEIEAFMQQLDSDIEVIWGTSTDNSLGKDAKVIILAAAMAHEMQVEDAAPSDATQDEAYYRALMQKLYVDPKAPVRTVIEKVLEFKDEEPTEAPTEEDTPLSHGEGWGEAVNSPLGPSGRFTLEEFSIYKTHLPPESPPLARLTHGRVNQRAR